MNSQCFPHSIAQGLSHRDFVGARMYRWAGCRKSPASLDRTHNRQRDSRIEVDKRPANGRRLPERDFHAAAPAKLSAKTKSASSNALPGIQKRRAAGLIMMTSLEP